MAVMCCDFTVRNSLQQLSFDYYVMSLSLCLCIMTVSVTQEPNQYLVLSKAAELPPSMIL